MFVLGLWSYWYRVVQGFIKYSLRNLNLEYNTKSNTEFQSYNALALSTMSESAHKYVTKKGILRKKLSWVFLTKILKCFHNFSIWWHQIASQCPSKWGHWCTCIDCAILNELRERQYFLVMQLDSSIKFYAAISSMILWNEIERYISCYFFR